MIKNACGILKEPLGLFLWERGILSIPLFFLIVNPWTFRKCLMYTSVTFMEAYIYLNLNTSKWAFEEFSAEGVENLST